MLLLFCLLLLGAVDLALVVYACLIRKRFAAFGSPPFSTAVALFAAALLIHSAAALPMAQALGIHDIYARAVIFWLYLLFGVLPVWCFGRIVLDVIAASLAGVVFGMRTVRPMRTDFGRARELMVAGDVEGAVKAYRSYLDESPDDPQPLYELACVFEGTDRPQAAAELYAEIMRRFQGHATQWAKAAYFLASLREGPLADYQAAIYLYQDIIRKAPKTTYADFSQKRLAKALKPSLN